VRRVLVLLAVLLWTAPAFAITYGDAWDTYGTVAFSGTPRVESIGPYNVVVCGSGGGCSSNLGIMAITAPPWNPNGSGHFLQIASGGTTNVPNAGPGVYFQPRNPQTGWLIDFWFKYEGTITNAGGGPFVFRLNTASGQSFGGDNIADAINSDGTYNLSGSGTTTNAFSSNTWYLLERCVQYGTTNVTGSTSLYVSASPYTSFTNWKTVTATSIGSSGNWGANNFTFDNEFGTGTFDFGPWAVTDIGTTACPATSSSPFNSAGVMYAKTYLPTANSTPLQFTASTGSNYSNVNSNPAGANYNSNATVGNQDIYTFGVPGTQTGIALAVLGINVEQDNLGERLALPTWKSNSGTVTAGTLQNVPFTSAVTSSVLVNGTYNFYLDGETTSIFGGSWSAADLAHAGIQLND
jgi:hypothetical protein